MIMRRTIQLRRLCPAAPHSLQCGGFLVFLWDLMGPVGAALVGRGLGNRSWKFHVKKGKKKKKNKGERFKWEKTLSKICNEYQDNGWINVK